MEQNGATPDAATVTEPATAPDLPATEVCTQSVYTVEGCQDGFAGTLALKGAETLNENQAGAVLARLDHLVCWAQAQQARILNRFEEIYRDGLLRDIGKSDPGLAFTLAAAEAATILRIPQTTGQQLMGEAGILCSTHTATLQTLEAGTISYGHVQTVLDQSQCLPPSELGGFEAALLAAAAGQTRAQFRVRARRLRENKYPETATARHHSAFERRRVCLEPESDGMSWLSAFLPAEKAQAVYTQLTTAARGEQAGGDPRPVDQLRADIFADLLGGGNFRDGGFGGRDPGEGGCRDSGSEDVGCRDVGFGKDRTDTVEGTPHSTATSGDLPVEPETPRGRTTARTELLVLITAETLFGADNQPAELHGYGPISSETARRLAREAAHWTPVEQHPDTEEILRVGRRRKVPAGLKHWLRARDGTCRFPGCRSNAVNSEIDHTRPWAQGGATDHDNLEHLCRRHHMFKTRGFWKARQPRPGVIEWTSPGGRSYRTDPHRFWHRSSWHRSFSNTLWNGRVCPQGWFSGGPQCRRRIRLRLGSPALLIVHRTGTSPAPAAPDG